MQATVADSQSLQDQLAASSQAASDADSSLIELKQQHADLKQRHSELQQDCTSSQDALASLQMQHAEAQASLKQHEQQAAAAASDLNVLRVRPWTCNTLRMPLASASSGTRLADGHAICLQVSLYPMDSTPDYSVGLHRDTG